MKNPWSFLDIEKQQL